MRGAPQRGRERIAQGKFRRNGALGSCDGGVRSERAKAVNALCLMLFAFAPVGRTIRGVIPQGVGSRCSPCPGLGAFGLSARTSGARREKVSKVVKVFRDSKVARWGK